MKYVKIVSVILIITLSFFMFPLIPATIGYLHERAFSFFSSDQNPENEKRAFDTQQSGKQFGGEYVLPPPVQLIIRFLRTNSASSFRLSPEIQKDAEISQRLIEGSYPIRCSEDAHFFVHFDKEAVPRDCKPLFNQNGVVLAYCP